MSLNAREMREAGMLWPQNLTDDELRKEWDEIQPKVDYSPISYKMLIDEINRRHRNTLKGGKQ